MNTITADIAAFNELYSLHHKRFIHFAYSYLHDRSLAEDFTNEALLYFWENKKHLKEESNIPAYILKIIKNKSLNYLRQQQIHQEATSTLIEHQQWELQMRISSLTACDPDYVFRQDIIDIVNKTLEKLPEQTRLIFTMSRVENKSHKEIAEFLGITVKGVDFHIAKAVKILRKNLKDYISLLLYLIYLRFF